MFYSTTLFIIVYTDDIRYCYRQMDTSRKTEEILDDALFCKRWHKYEHSPRFNSSIENLCISYAPYCFNQTGDYTPSWTECDWLRI